jgi:hypothetical protein
MSNDSREALTDEAIKAEYERQLYRKNDLNEPVGDVIVATVRALLSRHASEREALVRKCADAVMKVYVNPTPEELGVMYDCRDAVLKAPNRYIRQEQHDKRIARGDDFAGDAWLDKESNEIVYGVVGHDMNGNSALLSDSGSQG